MGHPVDDIDWRKSSYSGSNGGNCVEVAALLDASRAVRDSKDTTGPHLTFTPAAWQTFLAVVANDEISPH